MLHPTPAAVLAGEYLAAAARAVHAAGLPLVEGDGEHRGLRLNAHVRPRPARAAVGGAEQGAAIALEVRAGGHPDRPRIARDLADVAAVCLTLGIQRLEAGTGPVLALVRAAEETGAADRQNRPGTPASDQHAVHVHGIVVHVLPVAHVLPVLAAVESADDAADLDGAVDLIGVGGIGSQLQDPFHGIGPRGDGHLREAD